MPTYLYSCDAHGEFEAIQSIKDAPLEKCPKCVEEKFFENECYDCDTKFVQEFDAMSCPNCMSEQISGNEDYAKPVRLIAGSSFILAGGGWASEGYSSKQK